MARSKAWSPVTESLTAVLAVLDEDQYLILERKDEWGYVQFAAQGLQGLRAEAMSNAYLSSDKHLSPDAVKRMTDLGWFSPTSSPDESSGEKDPNGSPNYFVDWAPPVPFDKVAQLAVDTLVDVYEIAHPGALHYKAFARDGSQILLPTLGVSPQPSSAPSTAAEPDTVDAIRERILEAVRNATSNPALEPDQEGDIPIRFDSSAVFVRIFGESPVVRVWSPVLGDVEWTPKLIERVNELNEQQIFVKWLAPKSTVVVAMDLFGRELPTDHVLSACSIVGDASNDADEQLQAEFGGKTFFGEAKPPPRGVGGYL